MSKQTPIYFLAGVLIAGFQIVGRSNADRFFAHADSSALFEPRLWVLVFLSCWLFVVAAVRSSEIGRTQARALVTWRTSTVVFLGYMILSSLWAPDASLALEKAYDLLVLLWCCVLASWATRFFGAQAVIDGFWLGIFLSAGLLAAVGLLTSLSGHGPLRLAVFGGGPNVYGRNMGLLTIASIHFSLGDWRWIRRVALVIVPLASLLVFQSGSRGAMLALFVGVVVFLVLRGVDRRVVYSGLLAMVVAAAAFATQFGAVIVRLFHERVLVLILAQRYYTHRDTLLLDGITAGFENPVGGLGLAGFVQLDSPGLYPHNFIVEALSEGGFIGLFLLTIPFVFYLRRWRRGMTMGHPLAVAGLSLLVVSSSISGDLFDARGVFLGLLMVLASQTPRKYDAV